MAGGAAGAGAAGAAGGGGAKKGSGGAAPKITIIVKVIGKPAWTDTQLTCQIWISAHKGEDACASTICTITDDQGSAPNPQALGANGQTTVGLTIVVAKETKSVTIDALVSGATGSITINRPEKAAAPAGDKRANHAIVASVTWENQTTARITGQVHKANGDAFTEKASVTLSMNDAAPRTIPTTAKGAFNMRIDNITSTTKAMIAVAGGDAKKVATVELRPAGAESVGTGFFDALADLLFGTKK